MEGEDIGSQYSCSQEADGYLFLFPAVVSFIYFVWYPLILTFVMSFQKVNLRCYVPVGIDNFQILADPVFGQAHQCCLLYNLALIIGYLFPAIVAVLINEVRRGGFLQDSNLPSQGSTFCGSEHSLALAV